MSAYDLINKQLNDEMQSLAELIKSGNYTERDRNRLASIMYPKLKFFIWKFFQINYAITTGNRIEWTYQTTKEIPALAGMKLVVTRCRPTW
jgi:hypothetical protein